MSRIRNAWRALMGAEPEAREAEVHVGSTPVPVTLYRVTSRSGHINFMDPELMAVYGSHHLSCEAAFASIAKRYSYLQVESVDALLIGGKYFGAYSEIKVKKPKRAKGQK